MPTPFFVIGNKQCDNKELVWVMGNKKAEIAKVLRILQSNLYHYEWYFLVNRADALRLIDERIKEQNVVE